MTKIITGRSLDELRQIEAILDQCAGERVGVAWSMLSGWILDSMEFDVEVGADGWLVAHLGGGLVTQAKTMAELVKNIEECKAVSEET